MHPNFKENMPISNDGESLVKYFEGCKDGDLSEADLQPYLAPEGYWTVAHGHLIIDPTTHEPLIASQKARAYELFPHVTPEQDIELLNSDLHNAESRVRLCLPQMELKQCELDSLISQAYNISSFPTLAKHLRVEGREIYLQKLLLYCHDIKGHLLPGLLKRRQAEKMLFEGQSWQQILTQI